jgi:hypothetical protein
MSEVTRTRTRRRMSRTGDWSRQHGDDAARGEDSTWSWASLRRRGPAPALFRPHGTVLSVKVQRDDDMGQQVKR